jgi:pimeloyl-ACP methyl ester carboxylesterase
VRFVAPSRAGYGGSSRSAARRVAAVVADTAELCDALSIERFATAGWSGGGPHALACAALLRDRCVAAISLAGIAPHLPGEFDWVEGMAEENIHEFELGLEAGPEYDEMLAVFRELLCSIDVATFTSAREVFGDLVSDADIATTTRDDAIFLLENMRYGLGEGTGGWRDDDQAFLKDWEFDVSSIEVPTAVWFGDQDHMVPERHGEWLAAHVPTTRVRRCDGDGHLTVGMTRMVEVLDELRSLAGVAAW